MAMSEPPRSTDLGPLLQAVVDDAVEILGIDAAVLYVRSPNEACARWACDAGMGDGEDRRRIRAVCLPVVSRRGQATTARRALLTGGASLRLVAAEPVTVTGPEPRGAVCLLDRTARTLAARDGAVLRALATRAALALERADLVDRLDEVEARHHFLLDRLPDVIWAAGADRILTYISAGSERLLGYRPEELVGRSSTLVMHESSSRAFEEGYRWQIAHPDGDQTYRVNLRHKDGHPVPVELHNIGTPIDGRYGGGTGSVREISDRIRLEREIQEQAAELAAGRERAHLAQELHDSVTQALFGMTMAAGTARMMLEQDRPGVAAKLDELGALAREALAEMRGLILELRPGSLAEEGLEPALRRHIAAVQGRTGLRIRLDVAPDPDRLPLPTEDALYRIAQEAIHNVVKHAGAHEVSVRIGCSPGTVRMEIRDDGGGFDPRQRSDGLGSAGMAARAERLGGSVRIQSAPGRGTVVTAILPRGAVDAPDRELVVDLG